MGNPQNSSSSSPPPPPPRISSFSTTISFYSFPNASPLNPSSRPSLLFRPSTRRPPPFPPSSSTWFHCFLSLPSFTSNSLYPRFFRMSIPTLSRFLSILSPSFLSLPPDSSLAAALFRLAHNASYKFLAPRFGFSSSADVCRAFYTVCKLVNDKLSTFLDLQADITRILVGFGWIASQLLRRFGRFKVSGQLMGSNGELLPEENAGDLMEDVEELRPVFEEELDESGRRIRDAIAQHLNRVSLRK